MTDDAPTSTQRRVGGAVSAGGTPSPSLSAPEGADAADPVAAPPPASATEAAAVPPPGPPPEPSPPSPGLAERVEGTPLERPEVQVGAALAGGFVVAFLLKRLGR